MLETYRPSGNFNPMVFGLAVVAVVLMFILGIVYQALTLLCPFIILNALILMGMAIAIGKSTEWTLRWGQCRHAAIGTVIGVVLASVALFASYRFSKGMIMQAAIDDAKEANNPDAVALAEHMSFGDYVDIRKSEGWSVGMRRLGKSGIPINGMFVYLFWAIEAGTFALSGVVGASLATGRPFCETCGKWAGKPINVWSVRNVAASNVAEIKAADDLKGLFVAAAQKGMPTVTFNFNLATCPACSVPGYLTVEKETLTQDKDGKEKIEKTDVVSHILAEPQEVARVAASMKR